MKLILINPDYMAYGDPPLGLAYLAAYLRKTSSFLSIKIFDQLSESQIVRGIKKEKPDIIGMTAVSQNYHYVEELARKLKKVSPHSLLILGGVHITTHPNSFKDSIFDIAVRGEGEIPASKLLEIIKTNGLNINRLKNIPGLLLRSKERIINTGLSEQIKNLDDLPMPSRNLLNMKYYTLPRFSSEESTIDPIGSILTSRGCPYNCKFCASTSFWKRNVRFFSAKRVADEIFLLNKKYGYRRIVIYDDLFSMNKKRLKEIITRLQDISLLGKISFTVYGRANCFDEETAKLLRKMGVKTIFFGFESGSERMLKYLKGEGISIMDNINAIKFARKYKIVPGGFFMAGSPTEKKEEMNETYEFIKKYIPEKFIIYQTIAFPGTEFWDYALEKKILDDDFYEKKQKEFIELNPDLLLSEEISKDEFMDLFKKIKGIYLKNNKRIFLQRILSIHPRHMKSLLSIEFLKKVIALRSQFLKRIFPVSIISKT